MKVIERIWKDIEIDKRKVTCPICGQVMEKDGIRLKNRCSHAVDWSFIGNVHVVVFEKEINVFYPKWFADRLSIIAISPTPERIARALEEISFHRNWGDIWGYLFPGSLSGWGNYFDGGVITYRNKDYYFDTEAIRKGAIRQVLENKRWSRRDWVRFWKENQENISLQGASGRIFQLSHSK